MQIVAGIVTPVKKHGDIKMPDTVQKLVQSLDTMQELRSVNVLLQGFCSRSSDSEIAGSEARGLMVLLGWQNEKMEGAELAIQTALSEKAAPIRAA
jgi:hypothetical protein